MYSKNLLVLSPKTMAILRLWFNLVNSRHIAIVLIPTLSYYCAVNKLFILLEIKYTKEKEQG